MSGDVQNELRIELETLAVSLQAVCFGGLRRQQLVFNNGLVIRVQY